MTCLPFHAVWWHILLLSSAYWYWTDASGKWSIWFPPLKWYLPMYWCWCAHVTLSIYPYEYIQLLITLLQCTDVQSDNYLYDSFALNVWLFNYSYCHWTVVWIHFIDYLEFSFPLCFSAHQWKHLSLCFVSHHVCESDRVLDSHHNYSRKRIRQRVSLIQDPHSNPGHPGAYNETSLFCICLL